MIGGEGESHRSHNKLCKTRAHSSEHMTLRGRRSKSTYNDPTRDRERGGYWHGCLDDTLDAADVPGN